MRAPWLMRAGLQGRDERIVHIDNGAVVIVWVFEIFQHVVPYFVSPIHGFVCSSDNMEESLVLQVAVISP